MKGKNLRKIEFWKFSFWLPDNFIFIKTTKIFFLHPYSCHFLWKPCWFHYSSCLIRAKCDGLNTWNQQEMAAVCLTNTYICPNATLTRKNMNLLYSIRTMYWTNFWQPTVHVQQNIFEKTLNEFNMLLLAPLAFKLVNHSRYSEILNFRKNSKSTSFSFENNNFTVFIHFSKIHCASNN